VSVTTSPRAYASRSPATSRSHPQLTPIGCAASSGHFTLYCGDQPIGAGDVARTKPFQATLSGDGLCCAYDGETPVSDLYQAPYPSTGNIERVVVSVTGEPYRNTGKEVQLAITRD
jgi:hypothetical protein